MPENNPKKKAASDAIQQTRFFTTTVFLHPTLPQLAIVTLPSPKINDPAAGVRMTEDGMRPVGSWKDWDAALTAHNLVNDEDDILGLLSSSAVSWQTVHDVTGNAFGSLIDITGSDSEIYGQVRSIPRSVSVMDEPIPVMHSPIEGTTLAKLFATTGSGAAFLAYFPHPDFGQIATFFLVVGGTKIVLGAADGIGYALRHGLAYVILKWMGAPIEIVEAEKQKVVARNRKADAQKKVGTPGAGRAKAPKKADADEDPDAEA